MPGDGTKLATTTHNSPPARLLDLTRLMRHAGRILTGVDRVEYAYVRALLDDPVPVFGLIRSRFGYLLLDQSGIAQIVPFLSGPSSEQSAETQHHQAWRTARRAAIRRVPPPLLRWMLRRHLPRGATYLNVGHSNLTARVLTTLRDLNVHIAVLIHDVIPLDYPQYQRDGTVQRFLDMLMQVELHADLVIYNSEDTKRRTEAHLKTRTASIVAHLGTEIPVATPEDVPPNLRLTDPYFVTVGTIEPRKNHAFLLDIWENLGPDAPALIIAGGRGWKNEAVFARLDALAGSGNIHEVSGLGDGVLAALVAGSSGVLFPTHAEGFGLPATEAAMQRVPLIVNDLPVFREFLNDIPVYASVSDRYLWINKIKELAGAGSDVPKPPQFVAPTWDAHFKTVLRLT